MWRRLRLLLGFEKQGGFIKGENINDGFFELINGRRIYIKGADNEDALRGEGYSFVVLDEYADMKPGVFSDIIDPALMDVEGSVLFIGTPKGKNHFYKLFTRALEGKQKDWEAFHFKSSDNPFIKEAEITRITNDPNKSRDAVRQELEASFLSGGSKILNPDSFRIVDMPTRRGTPYITVDLAGFGTDDSDTNDETVICVTLTDEDKWTVVNMQHGRWDVRKTAFNIVQAVAEYPGARLGIEKGALSNAVGPYLEEYMRTFNRYVSPEPLTHGNTKKYDRIQWALQGRSERHKINLVRGDWNDWFLTQVSDFPDPLSHDDGLDALAYVDQMSTASFVDLADVPEWECLDVEAGY
jgi:phage terminase large subunit-like protein